jgi:hypothetical protein
MHFGRIRLITGYSALSRSYSPSFNLTDIECPAENNPLFFRISGSFFQCYFGIHGLVLFWIARIETKPGLPIKFERTNTPNGGISVLFSENRDLISARKTE